MANIFLIAAAPDLLEALQDVLHTLRLYGIGEYDDSIRNAHAAIAKAVLATSTIDKKDFATPCKPQST